MNSVLILIADPAREALNDSMVARAVEALRSSGLEVSEARWLAPSEACEVPFAGTAQRGRQAAELALDAFPVDVAALPAANRRKRLLVADMDSTILQNETLDELADYAGFGERVAAITERSMRGEIDFGMALRERVALLEGLSLDALAETAKRMRLMPGARELVRTMRANGAYTALASGGFRYFTGQVARDVGFHEDVANVLLDDGAALTGRVEEPIFDRESKRKTLERLISERGIDAADSLAVGDGANDLAMIGLAGLGVAYRAKPVVAAAADARIAVGDLTGLLYLQGYRKDEFVR